MRFRKKPVEIEAVQWDGSIPSTTKVLEFVGEHGAQKISSNTQQRKLFIHTLEGVMEASEGDWIIRGVCGEFYPCKPDIFAQTYEPVE